MQFDDISSQIKNGVDHIVKLRMKEKLAFPSKLIKIEDNKEIKVIRE